jgi:hypothetical protein
MVLFGKWVPRQSIPERFVIFRFCAYGPSDPPGRNKIEPLKISCAYSTCVEKHFSPAFSARRPSYVAYFYVVYVNHVPMRASPFHCVRVHRCASACSPSRVCAILFSQTKKAAASRLVLAC